jgi:hypothetical protein
MEGKISATIINHRDVSVKAGVLADCCSAYEDGIYSREVSLSPLLLAASRGKRVFYGC